MNKLQKLILNCGVVSCYLLIGYLFIILCFSGCASQKYMVRECGAITSELPTVSYVWVQPCDRTDNQGVACEEKCRPARSACEKDQASYRDPRIWHLSPESLAKKAYADLDAKIEKDCPKD